MSSYALDLLLHECVLLHGARVVVTLAMALLGSLHTIGLQAVQDVLQSATQRGHGTANTWVRTAPHNGAAVLTFDLRYDLKCILF